MHFRLAILATLAALLCFSCKSDDDPAPFDSPDIFDQAFRGEIVSVTPNGALDVQLLQGFIQLFDLDTSVFQAIYDVQYYTLVYKTTDWRGNEVETGGGIWLPIGVTEPVRLACYSHGTIKPDRQAPSQQPEIAVNNIANGSVYEETLLGALLAATSGYAVALHDYIGLGHSGDNPLFDLHPYQHAETQAYSGVDALRALRAFVAQQGLTEKDGGVFVFGYSQGGHATAAILQHLEAYHSDEFDVFAAAPCSAPLDLDGAFVDVMLSDEPYKVPGYLPYVLFSYNQVYNIYPDYTFYLKPEYGDTLWNMFQDGELGLNEVDNFMPPVAKTIVIDSVLNDFATNLDHPLRGILTENDLTTFTPQAPVLLAFCSGDTEVSSQNSLNAFDAYVASGAPYVIKRDGGPFEHTDCVQPAMTFAKQFIDSLEAL